MCINRTKKYSVDYLGIKHRYKRARDRYAAGKKVTLYYDFIATDTDYSFYVNGVSPEVRYSQRHGFVISFVMPDKDVTLECKKRNTMEYIPENT